MARAKIKWAQLNALQAAQLKECINHGCTVETAKNRTRLKGYTDTPLFKAAAEEKQTRLF
jgi:hypothetical protein